MIYLFLVLLGLAFGSFANATAWRLRQQEEVRAKLEKLKKNQINTKAHTELSATLQNLSISRGRSMCPHCHHQLAWNDLLPLISWASLRGKCRYCQAKVSWQYPLTEFGLAAVMVISYSAWPFELSSLLASLAFGIYILLLIVLAVLFIYDLKWMELPTRVVYAAGIISVVFVLLLALEQKNIETVYSSLIGSLGLGGFFALLYYGSREKWIGGGDVRLGFVMGFFLGWQKTILAVTLAAYIGTLVIIGALITRKYKRQMKLPFGPLLIVGWLIAFLWGQNLIDWYLRLIGL